MSKSIQTIFFLSLIILLGSYAMRDFFVPGYWESHDGIIHVMRLAHFDEALKQGQFPVRYLSTWMSGYGSAVFNFNWSLPYYGASLFHRIGASFETSFKLVLIISFILSGVFAFLFLDELFRLKFAAFVGSVIYLWVPYRFTDIFIRGAIGEACAFIFLPLLFWLATRAANQKSPLSLWVTVVWALFILTHNLIALFTLPLYGIYVLFLGFNLKFNRRWWKSVLLTFCGGLGLSAFFWLPAIWETPYINYFHGYGTMTQQFPSLSAIIYSPWKYAYSTPINQAVSMSFQVGVVGLVLTVLLIGGLLLQWKRRKETVWIVGFVFITIYIGMLYLSSDLAKPLYSLIRSSNIIGFPWRFLTFATFAASVIAAALVGLFRRVGLVIGIASVIISIFFYYSTAHIVSWRLHFSDDQYRAMVRTNIGFTPDIEFLPSGTDFIALLETKSKPADIEFFTSSDRGVSVENFKQQNLSFSAIIKTLQSTTIYAHQYYFPGWVVWIDDQRLIPLKDTSGLMQFPLAAGLHRVRLAFENTPIRLLANGLSIISLIGLVMVASYNYLSKRT